MKVARDNDQYTVNWTAHMDKKLSAIDWCAANFGTGWGSAETLLGPGATGIAQHLFKFHRLYHAQWFILRWSQFAEI